MDTFLINWLQEAFELVDSTTTLSFQSCTKYVSRTILKWCCYACYIIKLPSWMNLAALHLHSPATKEEMNPTDRQVCITVCCVEAV